MLKKFALTLMMSTALLINAPSKAKASLPVTEIIAGAQLASELFEAAEPMLKFGFKAFKKGSKKLAAYLHKKRKKHKEEDIDFAMPPYKVFTGRAYDDEDDSWERESAA